jgi:hypothetical protein
LWPNPNANNNADCQPVSNSYSYVDAYTDGPGHSDTYRAGDSDTYRESKLHA